jgi:hypothetical protein
MAGEQTDYKLDGLDSNAMPSHLALTVRGSLYPRPEGRKSLRGHVEMSVGFNLPPVLALVPEGVIRGVGETVSIFQHLRCFCASRKRWYHGNWKDPLHDSVL